VDTTKKRLENLGYFSKVETYPEDTDVPGRKDLTILVQEKRTGSLSIGGGFSTVEQLVGTVELTQGNFDLLNWPAFTGGGQKFRLRLSYGSVSKNFLLSLTEPYFLDRRLSLGGSLFYSEADYLSTVYNQRNYGFSIELRKPLTSFMYASLVYQLQNVEIYNVPITAPPAILEQQGTFTESKVTTSLVFDRRDNPLLTRSGQLITLTPYIAGGFLGGDTQIYGWDLQGSQYFPLKWGTILLINGEIATVDTWGNGSLVPLYERLYLGGANDLRGFPYREVGPQQDGQPIGGQSMARLTVEWTFPIIEQARGAFFYDSGFVNSNPWSFGIPALANDVGFGIRLNLPIGPMRLDYGYPLKRDGYHGGGHFNFSVGYQF
jgi:outer membrane protein insertion porin family